MYFYICYFHFLSSFSFLLLFKYSCFHYHQPRPLPHQPKPPTWNLLLWALSLGPSHMFLYGPSLSFPIILFPLLQGYCLFFISMSLVACCLLACFVGYIPLKGEIIWYLSFTTWLISLSIILSRSI